MGVYNHTGQVVTDLERSKRFYQEVLGFKFWYEITPPDDMTAKLCGLTPPPGCHGLVPHLGWVRARAHALFGTWSNGSVRGENHEPARPDPPVDLGGRREGGGPRERLKTAEPSSRTVTSARPSSSATPMVSCWNSCRRRSGPACRRNRSVGSFSSKQPVAGE